MWNDLSEFASWVELETFFSGYLFVWMIILLVTSLSTKATLGKKLLTSLPKAYALVGTFYLALQLKNAYPDFAIKNIFTDTRYTYLKIWAILSICFWIQALNKKTIFSILHNLVYFILMIIAIYINFFSGSYDENMAINNIKILVASIAINVAALLIVISITRIYDKRHRRGITPILL